MGRCLAITHITSVFLGGTISLTQKFENFTSVPLPLRLLAWWGVWQVLYVQHSILDICLLSIYTIKAKGHILACYLYCYWSFNSSYKLIRAMRSVFLVLTIKAIAKKSARTDRSCHTKWCKTTNWRWNLEWSRPSLVIPHCMFMDQNFA